MMEELKIYCLVQGERRMSYKKGRDIKCPFDCLFHCMTRTTIQKHTLPTYMIDDEPLPEDFDKW